MTQYLLATYTVEKDETETPRSPDEMQAFMSRVAAVEQEMDDAGVFVFGGALFGPDASSVVRYNAGETVTIDGPFVESKEHIAGFYMIEVADLDEALAWADKVSKAIVLSKSDHFGRRDVSPVDRSLRTDRSRLQESQFCVISEDLTKRGVPLNVLRHLLLQNATEGSFKASLSRSTV